MPIYEYYCSKCDRTIEVEQKITAKPLTKCQKCGNLLEKLISKSSFQLNGKGWFKDGYSTPNKFHPKPL